MRASAHCSCVVMTDPRGARQRGTGRNCRLGHIGCAPCVMTQDNWPGPSTAIPEQSTQRWNQPPSSRSLFRSPAASRRTAAAVFGDSNPYALQQYQENSLSYTAGVSVVINDVIDHHRIVTQAEPFRCFWLTVSVVSRSTARPERHWQIVLTHAGVKRRRCANLLAYQQIATDNDHRHPDAHREQ
jgi:hypothetical protein